MIDQVQTGRYSSKAAAFVDANVAKLSSTLDEIVTNLTVSQSESPSDRLTGPIALQLSKINQQLHRLDSDALIERAGLEIEKRPATFTIVGALAGAIIAQIALSVVRRERRDVIDYRGEDQPADTV